MHIDRVAIVTGAGRGIGRAIAVRLAEAGFKLVLLSQTEEHLNETVTAIRSLGGDCLAVVGDASCPDVVEHVISTAKDNFGRLDVLVNNAGICSYEPVADTAFATWQRTLDVNLTAGFLFAQAVVPHMKEQGGGQIVHVGSDASIRAYENLAAYCATKFALRGFALAHAKEVRPYNIRVGLVHPGFTDTYLNNMTPGTEEKRDWLQPGDVADVVVYMLTVPSHVVVDELMIHPQMQE